MHDTPPSVTSMKRWSGLLRLMRPQQWIKNSFVLAPLVFAGAFKDPHAIAQALLAMALFCVASSAAYIVNDIKDVERDRMHPKKSKTRPLAAGIVRRSEALALVALLYGVLVWGWFLQPAVVLVICGYLALNWAYSFGLKHQPVLDIFTVAFGFVLRVYAGAQALSVPVSSWMFITTLCLALYLAAVKRRQELSHRGSESREVLEQYTVALVDRYAEMAATGALVFYSMFVMSAQPELVITVPVVLFGLFRYWFVVERLEGGESPTDALLFDLPLLATVLVWIGACLWVLWPASH
ncbi:decaprenyl-phosphate phosphoribosyltransferase [Acidovorax sp. Root219]|uniref:decaprenyl-phosphate phosphoribosyltransferase n=1 Tax=Acidovorax sp. Root219 TaxID=1736493 RepID=UPI00071086BE|nr:decaprenyl-phosphate phosphoribosyltransferase [Acidovorax sp. Root219]KRC29186.1 phosphoribose diphosphate--decaprenyl-phosphate phosphoribosyltransferase [Acidovorax sp. Root219]